MLRGLTGAPAPHQRVAVAHTAVHDALRGASRAEVRLMVDLAWGNGALLHSESADTLTWPLLLAALAFTDEFERALEICDTVLAGARAERSPLARATIEACRAVALYGQGRIAEAEAVAGAAMKTPVEDGSAFTSIALGALAGCHIERGRLDQAEAVLAMLERQAARESIRRPILLELRARLRLAQHRPREALEDALHSGRLIRGSFPRASPGAIPWRSTAADAHLLLGEPWHARKLAEEEMHDARRIGLTAVVIRDLRVLGLAAGGARGVELLSEAVKLGDSHPPRLEHIKALVDLGAALRRANRRADARGPLRQGLELSDRVGAELVSRRAHVELVATGARPRRAVYSGLDALTPSQRRVAGLASQGLTTRQIAETLFVTPKTVEFHLRHIYQKLDVTSRENLRAVLEAA
jgi:DNA-binding CsgD family transcriptional regulator